jgi:hypothetical protein
MIPGPVTFNLVPVTHNVGLDTWIESINVVPDSGWFRVRAIISAGRYS